MDFLGRPAKRLRSSDELPQDLVDTVDSIEVTNALQDAQIALKYNTEATEDLNVNNFNVTGVTGMLVDEIHNKSGSGNSSIILDEQKISMGSDTLSFNGSSTLELNGPNITINGNSVD